jgi:hypothetical protein
MGKFCNIISKVFVVLSILFLLSCSSQEDVPVADFDIARIEGEYSVNLNIEYSGPRPTVSVFNGSLSVNMTGSNDFTLSIEFPGDYITEVFSGSFKDKIVSKTNSAIGGITFEIQETSLYRGNPSLPLSVKTRTGETISVYAYFIESAGGEVEMNLHLIEKKQTPTTYAFSATK